MASYAQVAFWDLVLVLGLLLVSLVVAMVLTAVGLRVRDAWQAVRVKARRRRYSREALRMARERAAHNRAVREQALVEAERLRAAQDRMWAQILSFPGFAPDRPEDRR